MPGIENRSLLLKGHPFIAEWYRSHEADATILPVEFLEQLGTIDIDLNALIIEQFSLLFSGPRV